MRSRFRCQCGRDIVAFVPRGSRFGGKGRVHKPGRDHDLCVRCFKAEKDRARARRMGEFELREQNPHEFAWLLTQIAGCKSVLEIGSRGGASLRYFAELAGKDGKTRSIDISDNAGLTRFAERMRAQGYDCEVLIANSGSDQAIQWAEGQAPFDFVFIDGDHERGAEIDWNLYHRMARRFVGFHDINHESHRTTPLWKVIKSCGQYRTREYIADWSPMGIGLVECEPMINRSDPAHWNVAINENVEWAAQWSLDRIQRTKNRIERELDAEVHLDR